MKRFEIFINNKNSLELHYFNDVNDEYPSRVYNGRECFNVIKTIAGNKIIIIKKGIESLVLQYDGYIVNLNNFGELIGRMGMGPIATDVNRYNESERLKKIKLKKIKRRNKYIRVRIIAGALVFFILGSVIYISTKKKRETSDSEKTKQETISNDINNEEDNFEIYNNSINEVINETLMEEKKEEPAITINYEDRSDEDKVRITNAYYSNLISQYAFRYGLDPSLVLAIATQERGIHSNEKDRGGATGLMQIQNAIWENENITAYNFETNSYETLKITKDNIGQLHANIQIGCMYLQNCMKYMNYNIVAAVQCYNMGKGNMDSILKAYLPGETEPNFVVAMDFVLGVQFFAQNLSPLFDEIKLYQ